MFKKIFLTSLIFCIALTLSPAYASSVIVKSRERFSTKYPKRNVSVEVVKPVELKNGIKLEKNSVINGRIIEVKAAKRGKRNAYFVFVPISYTVPSKGITKSLKSKNLETKLMGYKKTNKKDTAVKASVSAGGLVVPGFSQAYWFSRGVAKPVKGKNRFSSGVYTMYKNSPFVYIEEGDELVVKRGTYLKMKFYYANKPRWQVWENPNSARFSR